RQNQEKAEPDEQFAEVLGLRRPGQRPLAHGLEPDPEVVPIESKVLPKIGYEDGPTKPQVGGILLPGRARVGHEPADRRQLPKAISPQTLAGRQRDEGLGRAASLLPIRIVLRPDLVRERK